MDNWKPQIGQWIKEQSLIQATLSQLRRKDTSYSPKTVIRPVELKSGLHYQFEYHELNKVTHENLLPEEAADHAVRLMEEAYRQGLFKTVEADVQLLMSKKGKASLLRKPPTSVKSGDTALHNRRKQRVLEEGTPVPFLVELGIMTKEGRVHAQKQDKFRQINRFLEVVSDVLPHLPQNREITIVDFGCGKSYLTFALYHLLAIVQKREIRIVGLDLKQDVIAFCSSLADTLGYERLQFLHGDIADYEGHSEVDMVVTLHACDTATDAALAKAVRWGASVILSVPCCQHELFGQISNDMLKPILSHGLLKERFSALATDAVRAQLLEVIGYRTQMVEFIDPEHTPKNLLIRAFRSSLPTQEKHWREYTAFRDSLCLNPYLERTLHDLLPKD
ncbi:class I SAM-dependent methyltransferase [Paenibacillus abyssi]|uniref:Methyltransferase n=1 Tax=Paenibacillus abyssi TaxID=1340531 RepID=A0A917CRQ5_9BACL|nr:SAM-dependent methyltransferase [Paenibacillus abyssi]GGF95723.1 methyltransferase [Paenibacillus abyssi]